MHHLETCTITSTHAGQSVHGSKLGMTIFTNSKDIESTPSKTKSTLAQFLRFLWVKGGHIWLAILRYRTCLRESTHEHFHELSEKSIKLLKLETTQHYWMPSIYGWHGGATVRHLGLRSVGLGFKSCSRQRCVTTLGKLFTPMCLCHQAV